MNGLFAMLAVLSLSTAAIADEAIEHGRQGTADGVVHGLEVGRTPREEGHAVRRALGRPQKGAYTQMRTVPAAYRQAQLRHAATSSRT